MILGFPKLRGFKSRQQKPAIVTLEKIIKNFKAEDQVDIKALKRKALINKAATTVKIIGAGKIDFALTFRNIMASSRTKEAVQKAGGSFKIEK